jgi:hypothetical protein
VKVHESVEDPEPVRLVGDRVQKVLFVVRLTTPANPLTAARVIVDVPEALTLTLRLVGLAVIVKSWTTNVMSIEWASGLLVPVTETCSLPVEANVQDSVALPEPVRLVGETVQDVLLVEMLTRPEKPLSAVIVMLEVPAVLLLTLTLVGLAAIVKSWTV